MQALEKFDRRLNRHLGVGQAGPRRLVIGLDGGRIFREGELEPDIGVGVAVGEVMNHLTHGPAAVAVRSVELGIVETGYRGAETFRELSKSLNLRGTDAGCACGRRPERPNGIAKVV